MTPRHNTLTLITLMATVPCLCAIAADVQTGATERTRMTAQIGDAADIPQMPGFPIVLQPDPLEPGSSEPAAQWSLGGAVLANLDGVGDLEIVHSYQTGGESLAAGNRDANGRLWAWDSSGNPLQGFPIELIGGAYQAPSVSDLDGDGDLEIVQLTDVMESQDNMNHTIRLYVFDHQGTALPGFPVIAGEAYYLQGASLFDLDSDGIMEIVFGSLSGLRVFRIDGSLWDVEWPVPALGAGIPAIGDVDVDGEPEIFVTGLISAHLMKPDGTELWVWPPTSSGEIIEVFFGWMTMAALADLDGDLDLEVVVAGTSDLYDGYLEIHVFHHDGVEMAGWPVRIDYEFDLEETFCSPIVTDLEGDGELEVLIGSGSSSGQSEIYAWTSTGELKPGFPYRSEVEQTGHLSQVFVLTAADANGDGLMEVYADSAVGTLDPGYRSYVFGIDGFGNDLPGFPLRPVGFSGQNGLVIDDVDNDGDYEAVSISRELDTRIMYVNMYDLSGSYLRSAADWPTFHAANERGGWQKRQYRGWRYIYAGGRTGR